MKNDSTQSDPEKSGSGKKSPSAAYVDKLLYSKNARSFLRHDGTWTKDRHLARSFTSLEEALKESRGLGRRDVVIYYSFNPHRSTEFDFELGGDV